jgi:hypothetical protein
LSGRKYRRNPDVVFRDIAGEFVLVPIHRVAGEQDSIYVLNGTGARVWELVDGVRTWSGVVEAVMDEFDVDRETAVADLGSLLDDMLRAGVLEEA